MDFQDAATLVLLYFPHSLTSIALRERKKKRKKNPNDTPSLQRDLHMAWHKLSDMKGRSIRRRVLKSAAN